MALCSDMQRMFSISPRAAMKKYTWSAEIAKAINESLYRDDERDLQNWADTIMAMKKYIRIHRIRAPLPKQGICLYRRMAMPPDSLEVFRPGSKVLFPNFLSTTRNQGSWILNGEIIFVIHINSLVGVLCADVADVSVYTSESELSLIHI